ncbi:hypothetical protein [Serratia proteamaculans]|uniref:Replication terminator protein n=1 Tax=Serratia proteamaculans TaxID=28151 RepID=A0A5Q2VE81_SERPR|nr:hypothetical protein [Serratia proteamaculans]QGH62718.1 hypothetical protein GHV41_18655 [Serratia proteamaculans]
MTASTPFSQQLTYLNKGSLNDELTEQLAQVVKAVRETGKAGSITLTLKVGMLNKANEDVVKISPVVAYKIPEGERAETIMWSTADGDLLRNDPQQPGAAELKQVASTDTERRQLPEQDAVPLRKVN